MVLPDRMYDRKDMNNFIQLRTYPNDGNLGNILQISRDETNRGDRVPKYHVEMIRCIFTVI